LVLATKSTNNTATRRCSWARSGNKTAPQAGQKRHPALIGSAQLGHCIGYSLTQMCLEVEKWR
jgi:hypothetical protein